MVGEKPRGLSLSEYPKMGGAIFGFMVDLTTIWVYYGGIIRKVQMILFDIIYQGKFGRHTVGNVKSDSVMGAKAKAKTLWSKPETGELFLLKDNMSFDGGKIPLY